MNELSRDDWILGGLALLLGLDLIFLPWFTITASAGAFSISVNLTGTSNPDGWLGVLAAIAAFAALGDLLLERFALTTTVPSIGPTRATTRLTFAAAAAAFVALKLVFHLHPSDFGAGCWLAIVLAAGLVGYTAQLQRGR